MQLIDTERCFIDGLVLCRTGPVQDGGVDTKELQFPAPPSGGSSDQIVTQTPSGWQISTGRAGQTCQPNWGWFTITPPQCVCLSYSYSVSHSQLCVTVCLSASVYCLRPPLKLRWGCCTLLEDRFCLFTLLLYILFVSRVNIPEEQTLSVAVWALSDTISGGN